MEPYSVIFSGCQFEENNRGGGVAVSAIQAECETLVIDGCAFDKDFIAAQRCIRANLSNLTSRAPALMCDSNDFSKSNCTEEPINITLANSGVIAHITDNNFPGLGKSISQLYKLRTLDATTTSVWEFTVSPGSAGQVEARLSGTTSDGGIAATYSWVTGFRRNASTTTLSTGTSSWTSGVAWNPDSLGTVPTADLSGNILRVRATGPAAETAGAFVVGRTYRIATVGTTDFTLVGAANNNVGTEFVATGVGTGTGTANVVMEWSCAIKLGASR